MRFKESNFNVQKEKYKKRTSKFLKIGASATIASLGVFLTGSHYKSVALPITLTLFAIADLSLATAMANMIAVKITDPYEPFSMREKVKKSINSVRKNFGLDTFPINNNNKKI